MAQAMAPDPVVPARGYWIAQDLEALPETARYEIVDGSLLVSPRPGYAHQSVAFALMVQLRAQLPAGLAVVAEMEVDLGATTRVPDCLVVRRPTDRGAASFEPGDVVAVVEVESRSSVSQDRILKPREYAAAGIAAYWRVELEPELHVVAHVLRAGAYEQVASAGIGESLTVDEPFPVSIAVDELLI